MYEIDNGINQTKCQNSGPKHVLCSMLDVWKPETMIEKVQLKQDFPDLSPPTQFLFYFLILLDQFMICKLIISFYFVVSHYI